MFTPLKTNGWIPKMLGLGKRYLLLDMVIFGINSLNFWGVFHLKTPLPSNTHWRQALVYIHCTAGLGRAPATALAYMFLIQQMDLDEAYAELSP